MAIILIIKIHLGRDYNLATAAFSGCIDRVLADNREDHSERSVSWVTSCRRESDTGEGGRGCGGSGGFIFLVTRSTDGRWRGFKRQLVGEGGVAYSRGERNFFMRSEIGRLYLREKSYFFVLTSPNFEELTKKRIG